MQISKEQQAFYQSARERCRQDVSDMNNTIQTEWQHLTEEVQRVQTLIQTLETRKQSLGQIYASASEILGLDNDLDISPAIQTEDSQEEYDTEEAER